MAASAGASELAGNLSRERAVLDRATLEAKAQTLTSSASSPSRSAARSSGLMELADLRQEMNSTWAGALSSTMMTANMEERGMTAARVTAMLGESANQATMSTHAIAARQEAVSRLMGVPTSPKSTAPLPRTPPEVAAAAAAAQSAVSAARGTPLVEQSKPSSTSTSPKQLLAPTRLDGNLHHQSELSDMRKKVRLLEADLRASDASLLSRTIGSLESEAQSAVTQETADGEEADRLSAALSEANRLRDQASVALAQADSMEVQRHISEQQLATLRKRIAEVQAEAEEDKIARCHAEERAEQAEAYAKSLEEQVQEMKEHEMKLMRPEKGIQPLNSIEAAPRQEDQEMIRSLEAKNTDLQSRWDQTRAELRETRKKWANTMSTAQSKFRAYVRLCEGLEMLYNLRLEHALTVWIHMVEESHPGRERTPLKHVVNSTQRQAQMLKVSNHELSTRCIQLEAEVASLGKENKMLEASLQSAGVPQAERVLHAQVLELRSQLTAIQAQHAQEVAQFHDDLAAEIARADDANNARNEVAAKAKATMKQILEQQFSTGAELQAFFIEDRASRLQAELDLTQRAAYAQELALTEKKKAREELAAVKVEATAAQEELQAKIELLLSNPGAEF